MSTPTMNHNSHIDQQQQQQQQQQQLTNEIEHVHLNSDSSPHTTLTRSDSTSTVILEEEDPRPCRRRNGPLTHPPPGLTNLSTQLRSLLKTSGLFNNDLESSDRLSELLGGGSGFTLQRLFSEVGATDVIDMNELMKIDSTKLLDVRTLSDFLRSESFDQLIAAAANNPDTVQNPPINPCSSLSFSELRPLSPELTTNNTFHSQADQMKMDTDNPLYSFNLATPEIDSPQFTYNNNNHQGALDAIEHDHAFLPKRTVASTATTTTSKRTQERSSRRVSTRIQTRPGSSAPSESHSTKTKRGTHNVSRATDVQTSDDLSYYLERRRKNNEASKVSRAVRKQKFGDMDERCEEYERVNTELRMKISTLETVTASLKSGLVNNFQRKSGV